MKVDEFIKALNAALPVNKAEVKKIQTPQGTTMTVDFAVAKPAPYFKMTYTVPKIVPLPPTSLDWVANGGWPAFDPEKVVLNEGHLKALYESMYSEKLGDWTVHAGWNISVQGFFVRLIQNTKWEEPLLVRETPSLPEAKSAFAFLKQVAESHT